MESVSVIIPTYNRANTLANCISSVLKQTYEVSEVLICDDGSTDDSKQLVDQINSPKVKWIDCGRNGRPAIPRNIGIKKSTSNWIAFLDSDDEWFPNKIELQIQKALANNAMALCTNARVVNALGQIKAYHTFVGIESFGLSNLLERNEIICSSVMLKRELLNKSGLFNEHVDLTAVEDYNLWLKIATCTPFVYLKDELVMYLDDPKTSIRSEETNINKRMYLVYNDVLNWVKENRISVTKFDLDLLKKKAYHFYYYNDTSWLHFKSLVKRVLI